MCNCRSLRERTVSQSQETLHLWLPGGGRCRWGWRGSVTAPRWNKKKPNKTCQIRCVTLPVWISGWGISDAAGQEVMVTPQLSTNYLDIHVTSSTLSLHDVGGQWLQLCFINQKHCVDATLFFCLVHSVKARRVFLRCGERTAVSVSVAARRKRSVSHK